MIIDYFDNLFGELVGTQGVELLLFGVALITLIVLLIKL